MECVSWHTVVIELQYIVKLHKYYITEIGLFLNQLKHSKEFVLFKVCSFLHEKWWQFPYIYLRSYNFPPFFFLIMEKCFVIQITPPKDQVFKLTKTRDVYAMC